MTVEFVKISAVTGIPISLDVYSRFRSTIDSCNFLMSSLQMGFPPSFTHSSNASITIYTLEHSLANNRSKSKYSVKVGFVSLCLGDLYRERVRNLV